MSTVSVNTAFNIDLEFELAPFHKRLIAYLIDFTILLLYLWSMKTFLYGALDLNIKENIGLDILLISLPMLLYSLLMESNFRGQTFGKKVMSIRVISLSGNEPTIGQFMLRWITKFFEWPFLFGYVFFSEGMVIAYTIITLLLGIGVVLIITINMKSQRLGDIAAGTVVVNTRSLYDISDTVFMHINTDNYQATYPSVMRLTDNDINTIKSVLTQSKKYGDEMAQRVSAKVQEVLKIETTLPPETFLEKLLEDYNYLATREK